MLCVPVLAHGWHRCGVYTSVSALLNSIAWKRGITFSWRCFARALWRSWNWRAGRKCGACNTLITHALAPTQQTIVQTAYLSFSLACELGCLWSSRVLLSLLWTAKLAACTGVYKSSSTEDERCVWVFVLHFWPAVLLFRIGCLFIFYYYYCFNLLCFSCSTIAFYC